MGDMVKSKSRIMSLIDGTFQPSEGSGSSCGIVCLYGLWNANVPRDAHALRASLRGSRFEWLEFIQVDENSVEHCLGDNGCQRALGPCPPSELPALLVMAPPNAPNEQPRMDFVRDIKPYDIFLPGNSNKLQTSANKVLHSLLLDAKRKTTPVHEPAIRIFVAGDRSSVGKSSISLGLLGTFLTMGYAPSELAYIKPATQCEAPQLVQAFCEKMGIPCVPVGPIVYYKGFTRAYLAGETDTSEQLLGLAREAVATLAPGKRILLIDGVGFPAVGSICGTDNASIARACGHEDGTPPGVIVVSPSGVGNAVDSFNLNASFFTARQVPVLGAIFNKVPLEGFYSLENCRQAVTSYFEQYQPEKTAFGFVPMYPEIAGDDAINHVDGFIQTFAKHVDVPAILSAASSIKGGDGHHALENPSFQEKKQKISHGGGLSRAQIEQQALTAGAAPGA